MSFCTGKYVFDLICADDHFISQVLPKEARRYLDKHGYVPSGRYKYRCPGEKLIDVSYHWAAAQSRPGLVRHNALGAALE